MTAPPILRVALPVPLPRLFDYLPPPGLDAAAVSVGARLRVPFGQRELCGVVVGQGEAEAGVELRAALAAPDAAPLLHGELLASLRWLANYLHAPLGEVLAAALPAVLRRGEPLPDITCYGWVLNETGRTAMAAMRAGKPKALAGLLGDARGEDWLDVQSPGWRAPLRTLRERGLVERVEAGPESTFAGEGVADAAPDRKVDSDPAFAPNAEQQAAIDAIRGADGFAPFLLDGVTGSGKTEVYLRAIADCLARGRQALVLVPEIGLTPQTLARFRARLGVPVHALHSGLTDNERAATWLAAASGQARVVVGTRSAVFVPLPEAGLIVVDEEHDGSYKQLDGIRYHARDFALVRARALGVPVVLGSATPSLEIAAQRAFRALRAPAPAPARRRCAGRRRCGCWTCASARCTPACPRSHWRRSAAALEAGGQVLVFKQPPRLCAGAALPRLRLERALPALQHARAAHRDDRARARPAPAVPPLRRIAGRRRRPARTAPAWPCSRRATAPNGIEAELQARFDDVPVIRIDRGSTGQRDATAEALRCAGQRAPASWSARRCWPRAMTSAIWCWWWWSASTKGCFPPISAAAKSLPSC